jgi:hypothetical protein
MADIDGRLVRLDDRLSYDNTREDRMMTLHVRSNARRARLRRIAGVVAAAFAISMLLPAGVSHASTSNGAGAPASSGQITGANGVGQATSTTAEQVAHLTAAQQTKYQAKVNRAKSLDSGSGLAAPDTCCTSPPNELHLGYQTVAQAETYFCGPATVQMMLSQYGVAIDQYTLKDELGTTPDNGTSRPPMQNVLNAHQSQDVYVWQDLTLDSGANYAQGKADLWNYTWTDIWYGDVPAYNVMTGNIPGYNFNNGHYFPARSYQNWWQGIEITDPWKKRVDSSYDSDWYSSDQVWGFVHDHPLPDQILW